MGGIKKNLFLNCTQKIDRIIFEILNNCTSRVFLNDEKSNDPFLVRSWNDLFP